MNYQQRTLLCPPLLWLNTPTKGNLWDKVFNLGCNSRHNSSMRGSQDCRNPKQLHLQLGAGTVGYYCTHLYSQLLSFHKVQEQDWRACSVIRSSCCHLKRARDLSPVLGSRNHLTSKTSTSINETGIVYWAPELIDRGHGPDLGTVTPPPPN